MKVLFFLKRACFALFTLLLFCFSEVANAHPYASGLTNNSGTLSFLLNEPATDVKVVFDSGAFTNDLGALTNGLHTISLSGHTSFAIVVSNAAFGSPFQNMADTALTSFYGPRGVAVNRNPQGRNFGRIYVLNGNAGTFNSRVTTKGVYVLNADTSDAFGYGATAYPPVGTGANQIQYGSSTTYGPFKMGIGLDDSVYVADASGALGVGTTVGGGVWAIGANLQTCTDLFTYNGTSTGAGLVCVCGTPNVTGSIGSNNLVLYTAEWNRSPYNNVWKYTMGGGPFPWTASPTQLANCGISTVNEVVADLCIAPDGKFFTSEDRSSPTDTNTTIRVFASDGVTPLYTSLAGAGGTSDPFYSTWGIAISPDDQYIATGTLGGNIDLCKMTNGIPDLSTFTTISTGFGTTCYAVAWDAADNVYGVSGASLLRVFSLGLQTVSVTSNNAALSAGTFSFFIAPTPPVIGSQPQSQTNLIGTTATFAVGATGSSPLSYQWYFNNTALSDGGQISG